MVAKRLLQVGKGRGDYAFLIMVGALFLGVFVGLTAMSYVTGRPSQSSAHSHVQSSALTSSIVLPPPEPTRITSPKTVVQVMSPPPDSPFTFENDDILQNPPAKPLYLPTRGMPMPYQQVGILLGEERGKKGGQIILPLIGRQTHPGSPRYHYYTSTDGYHPMKLPVEHKRRTCNDGTGCDEIFTGNLVRVRGYDIDFTAEVYPSADIPYIL
jgi:hypothetical protein